MRTLKIETPRVFVPLLDNSRYKGAWGGRGSGKSHFFAESLIEQCLLTKGTRAVSIREVQKTLKESSKRLIEDKLQAFRLGDADGFKVFNEVIQTPGDGIITFQGMQDHNAESIKSLEGYRIAWVEEAQTLSARSLSLLRPTIRDEGSELWFSWNPRRKSDAVDAMLRGATLPTDAKVVCANWRDNPKFPKVLEQERQDCLRLTPEQYDHIWEGGYAQVLEGAYYANAIAEAKAEGRIGFVPADPLMTIRLFWDIGGTGARADACAIWAAQFIGREIRVLNYYEAVGQPLATHINWLRSQGYTPDKAQIWLPHDGSTQDKVYDVSYESALKDSGYEVTVVPNQGKGAASARIEALRRLFPAIRFNQSTTQPGLDALGWYHEKRDENRNIGLGPEHDWSSHGCFHGDTKVLTRYGTRRIMELPNIGEVLTPCGWKQYINPRMTKRAAQLVEVVFIGGYSVKCTPDHLFLTESGWKSAESLMPDTLILSSLTRSRNISAALFTAPGRAIATFQKAAAVCIEMFGRLLLGRYQRTATFTTEMATSQIIGWKTWNVSTQRNICELSGKKILCMGVVSLATRLDRRPLSGMHLLKAVSGTEGMRSGRKAGQSGGVSQRYAQSATLNSLLSFAKAAIHRCIAVVRAKLLLTASEESRTNGLLRIANVNRLNETADVWDITVPDGNWFSLGNGAVVHNSDAAGLMAVAYEEPTIKRKEESLSISWMG